MTQFTTTKDILIPAGTVLIAAPKNRGGNGYVEALVGFGKNFTGNLVVQVQKDMLDSGYFERRP